MLGLGNHLQQQDGVAYLALHEGKTWLGHVFENGQGGGVEDLNQLHDHDLYKNHPMSQGSRFSVRNPHVSGAVLVHLEEILHQAEQEDSVAGLMRFLVAKFPAVMHKVLPSGTPEELAQLLDDDPDYFNELEYDAVICEALPVQDPSMRGA
eukprot:4484683-Amphidinium_carterae.1